MDKAIEERVMALEVSMRLHITSAASEGHHYGSAAGEAERDRARAELAAARADERERCAKLFDAEYVAQSKVSGIAPNMWLGRAADFLRSTSPPPEPKP